MANVQHSALTGASLHENKGVAAASANTVATAPSGATVWAKLTAANLTSTGNPFGGQLLHIRNEQTAGTNGASITINTWQTRVLNTVKTNEITSASLASNQITLPAGTYFVEAYAPTYMRMASSGADTVVKATMKLYNTTSSTDVLAGIPSAGWEFYDTTSAGTTVSANCPVHSLRGRFTLSGTSVLDVRNYVAANQSSSVVTSTEGLPGGNGSTEVYADVLIYKVA